MKRQYDLTPRELKEYQALVSVSYQRLTRIRPSMEQTNLDEQLREVLLEFERWQSLKEKNIKRAREAPDFPEGYGVVQRVFWSALHLCPQALPLLRRRRTLQAFKAAWEAFLDKESICGLVSSGKPYQMRKLRGIVTEFLRDDGITSAPRS